MLYQMLFPSGVLKGNLISVYPLILIKSFKPGTCQFFSLLSSYQQKKTDLHYIAVHKLNI